MYSERTAEEILEDMLENVRNDVDKREGSVVYDMQAPTAQEIEMLGFELDAILENGFMDTAQAEYVDRRAAEVGLTRKPAVEATGQVIITGEVGTAIPSGYEVYSEEATFATVGDFEIGEDGTAEVVVQGVGAGSLGNINAGEITGFSDLDGITGATNEAPFSGGVDEESDEDLKARYDLKVQKPAVSGSAYHYQAWALEIAGIGGARVIPLWNGPGTVKVILITTDGRAPSPEKVQEVTDYIEANRPIGANVTVTAIDELPINISATLTLDNGLLVSDVLEPIKSAISEYLLEALEDGVIRYVQIARAILNTSGVIDFTDLLVNDDTANIDVVDDIGVVLGEVTFT